MEIDATFLAPAASDRECAECAAPVHGPPGTICGDCATKADQAAWRDTVAIEYREARESIPVKYREIGLDTRGLRGDRVKRPAAVGHAMEAGCRTYVLRGGSGAGKTTLAVALLRAHLDAAAQVRFPRTSEQVARDLARPKRAGTARYARAYTVGAAEDSWDDGSKRELRDAEVLIVDDLGLEPLKFAPGIIEVVFVREAAQRQTIITTSWSDEMIDRRYGEGFRRRIQEEVDPIYCDAEAAS